MKSPLIYIGGKSKLAKHIVAMIPAHVCYCEPFCGAAWVLFTKELSKVEVINDLDGELVTFWRVIQNHLEEFLRYYKFAVISRHIFDLEKKKRPETLTDIQRAVRYFYLQRLAFGGLTDNRHFAATPTRSANLPLSSVEEILLKVHWRIERVTIENLDACECIRRYDRPTTFFYIDPPYWKVHGYAVKFEDKDFIRVRDVLQDIKGRFILSLNDTRETRKIFSCFGHKKISLTYSCNDPRVDPTSRSKPRHELLIHNLNLRKV